MTINNHRANIEKHLVFMLLGITMLWPRAWAAAIGFKGNSFLTNGFCTTNGWGGQRHRALFAADTDVDIHSGTHLEYKYPISKRLCSTGSFRT